MWRHVASNALTLFVVVLAFLGGLIAWGQRQYVAEGPAQTSVCVRVERGANMAQVSRQLEEQGAISNATIFRIGARYQEQSGGLRFGSYLVPAGASMPQVLDILTRGGASTCGTEINYRIGVVLAEMVVRELDPETARYVETIRFNPATDAVPDGYLEVAQAEDTRFRVTLAEGATSWQAVDALRRAEFLSGQIDSVPAEGTLAPDSYEVTRGADRAALVDEMEARQSRILADLWENRSDGLPIDTPEEALILASIVEKETGVAEERRQVASVFVNRLNQGMRLQTDPTVIYGITLGEGTLGRGLRRSELDARTPYNTYQIDGLPPTPIANPGRASIEAALNPDDTPYIYFVADGTGGHAFGVTLEEHNRNVARWREIERERAARGIETDPETGAAVGEEDAEAEPEAAE
ncbi:endolytic transglycosylase MltG [Halodurantibacterium flavum]|uniref:Endolytic murein transglycosylase n=1 Tax=Halodurantibacterium flavum TaxID=1382802 RepID=A0ABW4S3F6_9RHOB